MGSRGRREVKEGKRTVKERLEEKEKRTGSEPGKAASNLATCLFGSASYTARAAARVVLPSSQLTPVKSLGKGKDARLNSFGAPFNCTCSSSPIVGFQPGHRSSAGVVGAVEEVEEVERDEEERERREEEGRSRAGRPDGRRERERVQLNRSGIAAVSEEGKLLLPSSPPSFASTASSHRSISLE
jgi:hypothetical protein